MPRSADIQSVQRAFSVLRVIGLHGGPTPLATIAAETGLPKSTVSRLLATMVGIGVVEKVAGGEYALGPELRAIGRPATGRAELLAVAAPYLRALVDEIGEDIGLAVPDRGAVLYIDQVQSPQPVQVQDWTGDRFPMHTTAAGYVFLAAMSKEDLDAYLAGELLASGPGTETRPAALRREIGRTRRSGYAWTHEAWSEGINGAAAPIRDGTGSVVAAVNVFGPAYRFPGAGDQAEIGLRLAEVSDQISRHLQSP